MRKLMIGFSCLLFNTTLFAQHEKFGEMYLQVVGAKFEPSYFYTTEIYNNFNNYLIAGSSNYEDSLYTFYSGRGLLVDIDLSNDTQYAHNYFIKRHNNFYYYLDFLSVNIAKDGYTYVNTSVNEDNDSLICYGRIFSVLLKLDRDGKIVKQKNYGNNTFIEHLVFLDNGNLLLYGFNNNSSFIMAVNTDFDILWIRKIPGYKIPFITKTSENTFCVTHSNDFKIEVYYFTNDGAIHFKKTFTILNNGAFMPGLSLSGVDYCSQTGTLSLAGHIQEFYHDIYSPYYTGEIKPRTPFLLNIDKNFRLTYANYIMGHWDNTEVKAVKNIEHTTHLYFNKNSYANSHYSSHFCRLQIDSKKTNAFLKEYSGENGNFFSYHTFKNITDSTFMGIPAKQHPLYGNKGNYLSFTPFSSLGPCYDEDDITFEEKPLSIQVATENASLPTMTLPNFEYTKIEYAGKVPVIFETSCRFNYEYPKESDDLRISIEGVFIPNSFTPNYDGLNDEFKVICSEKPTSFHLQIYSRRGNLVFESFTEDETWKGENVQSGTYPYLLRINNELKRGFVHVIK